MTDYEVHTEAGHEFTIGAEGHAEVGDWVMFFANDRIVAEFRTAVVEAILLTPQEDPEPLTVADAFGA